MVKTNLDAVLRRNTNVVWMTEHLQKVHIVKVAQIVNLVSLDAVLTTWLRQKVLMNQNVDVGIQNMDVAQIQ